MTEQIKVPFNDLARSSVDIRTGVIEAVTRVIDSGWFVMGPEHQLLEQELAEYVGVDHAINVGNGTDALELGLAALGVREGSIVLTVANAGAYATTATFLLGAEPFFVDVDPTTHLMSAQTLETALSQVDRAPTAIVVTHLYGAMAPMESILKVAKEAGIPVLEDCAQSLGSSINGYQAGSTGDISTTSFYPTKNLGALGDGGAVFTNNSELAENVRHMRQYGWETKYNIQHRHGKNSRLDEMQAAILRLKLPRLEASNQIRRNIHHQYESQVSSNLQLVNSSGPGFNGHLAVLTTANRDKAREHLDELGIATDIHYPIPDHKQQFPDFRPKKTSLEVTEYLSQHIFSVPLFPEMTTSEITAVTRAISEL